MKPWQALQVRTDTDVEGVGSLRKPATDVLSIVVMVDGACWLETREGATWRSATYSTGDIGITVPGKEITIRWRKFAAAPLRTVHIDLPKVLFDPDVDLTPLDVLSRPDPVIAAMATAMAKAKAAGAEELYAQCAAQYLAAHLLAPDRVREPERHALNDGQMRKVVEYMRSNLPGHITLDDLAKEAALSRFHFLRLFTARTGRPPLKFLTELRITEARRRLQNSDEPIAAIGRKSGFPSASHFSATFSRYVGCSPTEYRLRSR
ncbi:helix-turn-helix domain-containing protein [Kibdelosporangium aridum]|uniref:helix-turn-helix domain-containing protein n=1 Tax=Kibdelosporangium aridum TaxID=2030 RepID=UPI0035EA85C1